MSVAPDPLPPAPDDPELQAIVDEVTESIRVLLHMLRITPTLPVGPATDALVTASLDRATRARERLYAWIEREDPPDAEA
jgi:hypothetical protein